MCEVPLHSAFSSVKAAGCAPPRRLHVRLRRTYRVTSLLRSPQSRRTTTGPLLVLQGAARYCCNLVLLGSRNTPVNFGAK